ncbi:cell division protein ZapA [Lacihabitans sp. LS3-19]|uniref:cell division protein ZapA n=1 Tax=Lacihabitans sp. LS3-19 TaxID=2487335 RepID=UPI0020CBBA21|nr:cell division protein ZapA [Lacihabitans sp. LS3-19]MCP9767421.1 cell division protein ZapA [Lacihabitans sp. LS3-19]
MESLKAKVVVNLNGEQLPFVVPKSDEPYFREAKEMLNDRLAVLTREYSAFASSQMLVSVLAVEALVDAMKINENYQRLKGEVQERLELIQTNFED